MLKSSLTSDHWVLGGLVPWLSDEGFNFPCFFQKFTLAPYSSSKFSRAKWTLVTVRCCGIVLRAKNRPFYSKLFWGRKFSKSWDLVFSWSFFTKLSLKKYQKRSRTAPIFCVGCTQHRARLYWTTCTLVVEPYREISHLSRTSHILTGAEMCFSAHFLSGLNYIKFNQMISWGIYMPTKDV